jgi:ABC-type branched-subunit amino acid transport system substrate-binding protein
VLRYRHLAPVFRLSIPTLVVAMSLALAACSGGPSGLPGFDSSSGQAQPAQSTGQTLGNGKVKVGLILPLTAEGQGAVVGNSLRNAAEMALAEFPGADLTLLVKDDRGSPEGAQAAAQEALREGAELIIGPLFAPSVQAAGQVARSAGKPVMAFSSDTSVASRGVFLLSFPPENDVNRVIAYASTQGRKSFAALVPDTAYGKVVEAAFQQAVASLGGRVVIIERFGADTAGFNAFAGRYQARFNSAPTRTATLAYDAVSLAAALARTQGSQRFSESVLTNASGFAGADGVFRFRPDGQIDRGLAVLELRNGQIVTVNAAPRDLGPRSQ